MYRKTTHGGIRFLEIQPVMQDRHFKRSKKKNEIKVNSDRKLFKCPPFLISESWGSGQVRAVYYSKGHGHFLIFIFVFRSNPD